MQDNKWIWWLVMLAATVALISGWGALWFLTDDAYIAFRYIDNARRGLGYVWNPPPILPVEGYTSFLWVAALHGVWAVTGVEPPDAANYVTLLFSWLTLLLAGRMIWNIEWSERMRPWRAMWLGLGMIALLTNRTFLAWTSSGLETAMFSFFIVLWTHGVFYRPVSSPWWPLGIGAPAVLICLTRPDGLLFVAGSVVMIAGWWRIAGQSAPAFPTLKNRRWLAALGGLAPMLAVAIHLLWRKQFYGEWLPNTYYAKVTAAWPQSGYYYLLSFILEYALWLVLLVVWAGVRQPLMRVRQQGPIGEWARGAVNSAVLLKHMAIGVILFHTLYYTFMVGGDHFEYRVYHPALILLVIALMWAISQINMRPPAAALLVGAWIVLSWPVQWTHFVMSEKYNSRFNTMFLHVRIAGEWPPGLRLYAQAWDELQGWLIHHDVCIRYQEHKIFHEHLLHEFPSREVGLAMSPDERHVCVIGVVGVIGWRLPHLIVLDQAGLNDYVTARYPMRPKPLRLMAHERRIPREYAQSFLPDTLAEKGRLTFRPRPEPLTDEIIVQTERKWRRLLQEEGITPESIPAD